jgi:hypothetical protein
MSSKIEVCKTCNGTGIEYDGAGHTCTACNGIAAPAVERQPFAYSFRFAGCVTASGPENWRSEIDPEKPAQFLFDDGRVKDFQPLFTAPPELAELQATIAQLESKLNRAINLDFERRETIAQQAAEIERLKSGQVYDTIIEVLRDEDSIREPGRIAKLLVKALQC